MRQSQRWKDPTDSWNMHLFSSLTYRDDDGIPIIPAYTGSLPTTCIPANIAAGGKVKPQHTQERNGFAHFYLDDYQFERFWNYPIRYVRYLQTFEGALSPDFSVYSDYPKIIQKLNVFRNRALGAYWNMCDIPVIPSISWNNPESFEWCFNAVEQQSVLAISTVGALKTQQLKEYLIMGYAEMISRLEPTTVLIYGRYPQELDQFGIHNIRMQSFHEKFEEEDRIIHVE